MKLRLTGAALLAAGYLAFEAPSLHAAIAWDAGAGTAWWFDPINWSRDGDVGGPFLPPTQGASSTDGTPVVTDAQINIGTAALPGGEGIVYDPTNDPNFAAAAGRPFPAGFGPQVINQLYISRNTTNSNLLTIKGNLESMANVIVGRSGSTVEAANLGRVNQLSGTVQINSNVLDVGNREASGWGNGIYDYRGGILEVSLNNGNGIRLSAGGSAGTGGHGRFVMHNPATPGYVRAFNFNVAAHAGISGNPAISPDGITTGVGIVEFHYENGGTRPIQVSNQLLINNGLVTTGTRSSRLELKLNEPVTLTGGVPANLGLFDVDFDYDPINSGAFSGFIGGAGDKGLFFSNADGSVLYNEGAMVSATFGSTQYNWTITYNGDIEWGNQLNADTGVVQSILGPGNGVDVVLIGHSSVTVGVPGDFDGDDDVDGRDFLIWQRGSSTTGPLDAGDLDDWQANYPTAPPLTAGVTAVPEPGSVALLAAAVLPLLGRRRIA